MDSALTVNLDDSCTSCVLPPKGCCGGSALTASKALLRVVDNVCRVALGVFACYVAPKLMAATLVVGVLIGGSYAAIKLASQQAMFPNGTSKPVCAQGYMDFLSGMRFPPLVGTIVTSAFIAAHIRHDPPFYVPFTGLFLGFWIGREAVVFARNLVASKDLPCIP